MRFQQLAIFLLITFAAPLSGAEPKQEQASHSRVVRLSLAGERLDSRNPLFGVKYDPKEDYYLVGDRNGPDKVFSWSLRLQPGTKAFEESSPGHVRRRRIASLPRLRTGSGINIGDTPSEVLNKLGERPKMENYDPHFGTQVWIYKKLIWMAPQFYRGKEREKWQYQAVYRFRSKRLWSIFYELSDPSLIL